MNFWRYMCKKILAIIGTVLLAVCIAQKANATSVLAGKLIITAINPGFTVDGVENTGEMFQISKLSDEPISLAGVSLHYFNSNDSKTMSIEFDDGDEMHGESLLVKYWKNKSSIVSGMSDVDYYGSDKSMSTTGGTIRIMLNGEVIDEVCWGAKEGCAPKFTSGNPTTLIRDLNKNITFDADYVPAYDPENPGLVHVALDPQCVGLRFSELLSYYETNKVEQFIEFYNDSDEQILLNGCTIKYKNKSYPLSGVVEAESYYVRYVNDFSLTKNPTSENKIELIDINDTTVDTLVYYNGQKKGVSWAQIGYDASGKEQWMQTYTVTPGEENIYQQWKTCPEGKVINEETGNCVKDTTIDKTLEACPAGKYRNPLTGRCKSYATSASSESKPCAEGYERNPKTNRCRKITTNTGAKYELAEETYEEKSNFVAIWAIVGVLAVGAGYVVFQYRKEITGLFRKKK